MRAFTPSSEPESLLLTESRHLIGLAPVEGIEPSRTVLETAWRPAPTGIAEDMVVMKRREMGFEPTTSERSSSVLYR